jgi:hypothetical protein
MDQRDNQIEPSIKVLDVSRTPTRGLRHLRLELRQLPPYLGPPAPLS